MSRRGAHDAPRANETAGDETAGEGRHLRRKVKCAADALLAFVGPALGYLFFIPNPVIGLLVWGAFALHPRQAAFALLGLCIGEVMRHLLHTRDEKMHLGGDVRTNALLAAVAVSWLTTGAVSLPLGAHVAIAAAAAASAAVLAAVFERGLRHAVLPGMVWAYCIVAGLLFMLFPVWADMAAASLAPVPMAAGPGGWAAVFVYALGAILFSPGPVSGAVVAVATLLWSRTMFLCGLAGWLAGVTAVLAFHDIGLDFNWVPASYNFYLAGMGLGAVFFLPGRVALLMAVLGGAVAAFFALVLQHMLPGSPIAYLPVSGGLAVWLGIAALARSTGKSVLWRNHTPWLQPEDAWWRAAHWYARFGRDEPLFAMPVAGPLLVVQGFDGALSHAGLWRYALDFQRPDDVPEGDAIWGAPVMAPASGVVERIRADVADNAVGVSNFAENWGNHIILKLDQGGYAMLAHLRQGTCAVTPGHRVETCAYLAEAGNSGRSPVPHLHLQAQQGPEPGAATAPFRMANFLSERKANGALDHWHAADVPLEGEIVMAAPANPPVHEILASMAPGSGVWTIDIEGAIPAAFRERAEAGSTRMLVTLDEAGRHIFSIRRGGALVTSLAPDGWRIIEPHKATAPLLLLLSLAVPSIPFAAFRGLTWDEPAPLAPSGAMAWLQVPLLPYVRETFPLVRCACLSVPGDKGNDFIIETHVQTPPPGLPQKMVCRFDLVRGPVSVAAEFRNGSVKYELMSFEPGLPFGEDSEDDTDAGL